MQIDIEITLEDAAFGINKNIVVPRMETCKKCDGSGAEKESDINTCSSCQGTGHVRRSVRTPFGMFQTTGTCEVCSGEGKIIKNKCTECRGTGRVQTKRKINVTIPAGIDSGSHLRISNEGEAGEKNAPPGDLYVRVFVKEHDIFERKGNDIYAKNPISFVQAVFGDEIEVPTLKGKARMTIPEGTQTGTLFRLKGKGIKRLNGFGAGDEYVKVIIQTPSKLTKKQKDVLLEYAKLSKQEISQKGFFSKLKEAIS